MDVLRDRFTPEELIGTIAWCVNIQPTKQPMSVCEFVSAFDWQKIPQKDIVVNWD
jgi:glutamyl-tRNA synthetase